mgnify:FL=1
MLFVSVITLVFVLVSIYFFFRAEKLQRKLITQQRDSSSTRRENKVLVDTMTLVATREQEFAKERLKRLTIYAKSNELDQLLTHAELITPLINNYSIIFQECLKGKGRLKAICQKCFENQDNSAYKKFIAMLITSNKQLKRYWSNDNLNGFLFLVDALLTVEDEYAHVPAIGQKNTSLPQK